jgi:arylsulfatase A-like enzyme/Tfp pilus assembly protein PilF
VGGAGAGARRCDRLALVRAIAGIGARSLVALVFAAVIFAGAIAAEPVASDAQPDVFLITIDTLRADHVGCYGYKDVETPTLDALAADGVRFTHAYTHSPITNTSHTTILTGLLPSVHGVTDFGVPLAPAHVTWAELLKKKGYQTGAFIGAVILDSNQLAPGLDRGFDFYDNFPAKAESKERWGRVERRAGEVVGHAEAWLEKHPRVRSSDAARFVWVHLYDPHDPYEPPPPFAEKYAKHLYDGEIAYADSALGHFIGTLKKSGAYENALIVVVGDHGEGLGEHGEETHGLFLYDSTLHVPLIMKLPEAAQHGLAQHGLAQHGSGEHGLVVDALVRTTDILPTALVLTHTPPPAKLDGESLVAYFESPSQPARTLFGETDFPLRWGWAPLRAVREQSAKFIEAPRPELYDLGTDPGELKNVYEARDPIGQSAMGGVQARLEAELAQWKSKLPAAANLPAANLPDPKDKVEVQNLLVRAMLAADEGRTAEARGDLEKAVQLDPEFATAFRQLGEIELAAQDYTKAAGHLKRAMQLRPEDSAAAYEAGQALERTGDYAAARNALEASLKQAPSQLPARLLLGRVYLDLRDDRNAEDQFEAALLVDSDNKEGRLGLAEAQMMKGDFAAAVPDLESLSKSDANNGQVWRLLARAYRGLHRDAEATRAEAKAAGLEKK